MLNKQIANNKQKRKTSSLFLVNEKLCQKNEKKYTRDIFCCCLGALLYAAGRKRKFVEDEIGKENLP